MQSFGYNWGNDLIKKKYLKNVILNILVIIRDVGHSRRSKLSRGKHYNEIIYHRHIKFDNLAGTSEVVYKPALLK